MQPILALAPPPVSLLPGLVEEAGETFDIVLGPEGGVLLPSMVEAGPVLPPSVPMPVAIEMDGASGGATQEGDAPQASLPGTRVLAGGADVAMPGSAPVLPRQADGFAPADTSAPVRPGDADWPPAEGVAKSRPGLSLPADMPLGPPDPVNRPASAENPAQRQPDLAGIAPPRPGERAPRPAPKAPYGADQTPFGPQGMPADRRDAPDMAAGRSGIPPVVSGRDHTERQKRGEEPAGRDHLTRTAPRGFDTFVPSAPPPSLAAPVVTIKETAGAMRPSVVPLSQLPAAVVSAMTGGEGIVIDLSPADLGRLRIELPATAGAVEVRLVVEQPDTLMLVRTAAETLAEDLRQAGIMAQTVTVELLAAERGDPARVDVPRPEPGGGVQNGMAAASGQDRPGSASPDSGAGFQRGPGGGPGRDGGPSEAAESRPPVIAERLDLRL